MDFEGSFSSVISKSLNLPLCETAVNYLASSLESIKQYFKFNVTSLQSDVACLAPTLCLQQRTKCAIFLNFILGST